MTTVLEEPQHAGEAPPGQTVVSARAIGSVAHQATLGCYGIVELVPQSLHVVVEYGLPIAEVAHNAIRTVYYAVAHAIGIRPAAVNVHVHGLRFSEERGERAE
jgi:uncharacterized alkaline shock family protein YloU